MLTVRHSQLRGPVCQGVGGRAGGVPTCRDLQGPGRRRLPCESCVSRRLPSHAECPVDHRKLGVTGRGTVEGTEADLRCMRLGRKARGSPKRRWQEPGEVRNAHLSGCLLAPPQNPPKSCLPFS